MKRFLALLIIAIMLLSFAACGKDDKKASITCWNCGKTISETATFCENCGSAVADNPNKVESSTSETENTNSTTGITDNHTNGTQGTSDGDTADTTEPPTMTPPTTPPPTTTPPTTTPPTTPPPTTTPPTTTSPTTSPTTEAPHIHSYSSKVTTAATCGNDGVKTLTCSCGASYTEKIAATGQHSWRSATCTTPKTCTTCSKTEGSATGHSWGNWETVTSAEVGKAGQERHTCSLCNHSETREIPALQEDLTKKWFVAQYGLAKQQYINSLEESKTSKQDEITDLKADINDELDKYTDERIDILNKYPPSATRDVMLTNAQQNYAAAIKPYNDKISRLESEIATIDAEIANPNVDSILAIVTKNCNISSVETYEYYYKYSDSLS